MNSGAIRAYSNPNVAPWMFRAVAFRHAADIAAPYHASPTYITCLRRSMRSAALTAVAALKKGAAS